jgi:hypothetical protein
VKFSDREYYSLREMLQFYCYTLNDQLIVCIESLQNLRSEGAHQMKEWHRFFVPILRWIIQGEFTVSTCEKFKFSVAYSRNDNMGLLNSFEVATVRLKTENRPPVAPILVHWNSMCSPVYLTFYLRILQHLNDRCCADVLNIILRFLSFH